MVQYKRSRFADWVKNHKVMIVLSLALLFVVIFYWSSLTKSVSIVGINTTSKVKNVTGLNSTVEVGDLSFKLIEVGLYKEEIRYAHLPNASSYHMQLSFKVTNNGEKIENVSYYCGKILFEDGTQYNFDALRGSFDLKSNDLTGICYYSDIIPGATIDIYEEFYFSDTYYPDYAIAWEKVPGSKIIYFTQQNNGLVKFSINKGEIVYKNESFN